MARKFSKIDEWELWVPPLDDEREIYKEDPTQAVTMELRFLTKEQRDYYQRIAERTRRSGAVKSADVQAIRQMFADNVRNVTNYEPAGEPVTDGADVFDADGDQPMINAVTEALLLRSSLEAGLAKKLRLRSGSCASRLNRKENGVAQDAIKASIPTRKVIREPAVTIGYQTEQSESSEDATANLTQPITIGTVAQG